MSLQLYSVINLLHCSIMDSLHLELPPEFDYHKGLKPLKTIVFDVLTPADLSRWRNKYQTK